MRPTLRCQLRLRNTLTPLSQPAQRGSSIPDQKPLFAAYYRGGTSRGIILQPQDLPLNQAKWQGIFRQILHTVGLGETYGRQLHRNTRGVDLSNLCLVEPYHESQKDTKQNTSTSNNFVTDNEAQDSPREPHLDYTFIGMDAKGHLESAGNCGNMTSAIGPYAYNARLLPPEIHSVKDGVITVTMRNTNTMKLVVSTFNVVGGQAEVKGNLAVDGVNGKGSENSLLFKNMGGSKTGKTFPTGRLVDVIEDVKVTCVDGAVPVVFVRADSIGIPGTIISENFDGQKEKWKLLEEIRRSAAVAMGLAKDKTSVPRSIPKVVLVSQSSRHVLLAGKAIKASQMDIVVRVISDSQLHHAIPLTAALTTAVAARASGSIVEQLLAPELVTEGAITIGHPSGKLRVKLQYDMQNDPPAWVGRVSTTAQRLFEGKVFYTGASEEANPAAGAEPIRRSLGLNFIRTLRAKEDPETPEGQFSHLTKLGITSSKAPPVRPAPQDKTYDLPPPPPTPRESTHLLRELSILRDSLKNFTTQYPSSASPRAIPQLPPPTPSRISRHLTAIAHHVNVLTASLKHLPRPQRSGQRGAIARTDWHKWAKMFRQWRGVARLREMEAKMSRRALKKSSWRRLRDRELNTLDKKGRFVSRGKLRRALLGSKKPPPGWNDAVS